MTAVADLEANSNRCLDDPNEGENRERKRAPVDERRVTLACEDGPERPRNRDCSRKVTLGRGERVSRSSCLQEEPI